ncbi:MAG: DUF6027 family protein [Actinomycetia bacterium]|nr:DUF6027 family protein [Actinomycetes bacterium]
MTADGDPNDEPVVHLTRYVGPWPDDDKDGNFKADVALYARTNPMRTIRNLASAIDVPEGAIVRYVLAKWASEGASGLLELGPTMTRRLHAVCTEAEAAANDDARLAAYHQLRQMLSWLHHPLEHPDVYDT